MDCELISPFVYKCEWRVSQFKSISAKSKPKQKLTSPVTEELPVYDALVRCRMMLFPKGTGRDENISPTVVIQFSGSHDEPARIQFSCVFRCVSDENEILDDIVHSFDGTTGIGGGFGPPLMCTSDLPLDTAILVLSCTFRPYSEERELMDNVRDGIFSFQSAVTSFMNKPLQESHISHAAVAGDSHVRDEAVREQASVAPHDQRYLDVLGRPSAGSFWGEGRWCVLLHVCIAFGFAELSDKMRALMIEPPSDDVKHILFNLCPPLRSRSLEASHDADAVQAFWNGLLTSMEGYSALSTVDALRARLQEENEAAELLHVLLFAVDPAAISYFGVKEVEDIVTTLRAAGEAVLEGQGGGDCGGMLHDALRRAEGYAQSGVDKQLVLRERIRTLVSYHTWHKDAEKCLVQQLSVPTVNPLQHAIKCARRLQEVLYI